VTQPELRQPDRLTPEEITGMVTKLVQDRLVVASALPEHMVTSVFMLLALGGLAGFDPASIGNIVEDIDKAGPRSVNGFPCFLSMQVIHKEDWKVIYDKYAEACEALRKVLGGEPDDDPPDPNDQVAMGPKDYG
jgi:hypothetical protein